MNRLNNGGVPLWAWCITWEIMLADVILGIVSIVGLLRR